MHARRAPPAAQVLPLRFQVGLGNAGLGCSVVHWVHASRIHSATGLHRLVAEPLLLCLHGNVCCSILTSNVPFAILAARSGPGDVAELELGTDASSFSNLLTFLSSGFGGGTGARPGEGVQLC